MSNSLKRKKFKRTDTLYQSYLTKLAEFQCFDTHGTKQKPVEQTATLTYKYKDLMNRDYSHY